MKKILAMAVLMLSTPAVAQVAKELSLDNSLTGICSQTKDGNQVNINFTGNNSFNYGKKIIFELGTNYQIGYSPNLSQNEFIQKANLSYTKKNWDVFTTYQYNYSLLRQITADNWLGVGGGIRENFKCGNFSMSYAVLYQNTNYFYLDPNQTIRHSVREKVKIEKKLFSFSIEYFYQPSIRDYRDYIVYGTSKLTIFPNNPLNFIAQQTINYRSTGDFKMIQNTTFGVNYKFAKKF